jgi:hypothetical protein
VRAFLVPEPANPADPAAVAVMVGVQGGRGLYQLGYVPRTLTPVVAALGGHFPRIRLVEGEYSRGGRGWPWRCRESQRRGPTWRTGAIAAILKVHGATLPEYQGCTP